MTIQYDPAGVFLASGGIGRGELADLAPQLEAARAEVLADAQLWAEGGKVPPEKEPLDAGYLDMPERLLADLKAADNKSELGRIRAAADRLAGVGRQRGRAGHRRFVHRRAGLDRSLLPPVLQRSRAGDAPRPAADVFRRQQRRQRRDARSAAAAAKPWRSLGHRGDQQERRHAGTGLGVSHPVARAAGVARQGCGQAQPVRHPGHRHQRQAVRPGRRHRLQGDVPRAGRRRRAVFGPVGRGPACRPRCWGSTS